ncbi:transcription termination factor NusA [uncultured Porphyromonas sp.]|uniref:transcription termination factor NusA n=1 Tax=uncultured Porphyromonas sp. TaxID=159274 RepID=UPI0026031DD6|nr:transcription termination factor NusA [uncultured Porphyromonas sp.]
MAKKKEPTMMEALTEYMGLKNIDEDTMVKVMEESLRNVIAKMFGTDHNFDIIVNPLQGDLEIWRRRIVVPDGEVENEMQQVSISEIRALGEDDVELGEEYIDEVKFAKFGRRAILNLKQSLASKVMELEKDTLYANYSKRVGELINAEIYQVWKKEVLLMDDEENELILPKSLAIPRDRFKKGERICAIIDKVEYNNNNPKIILSRISDLFMKRLFEREVPEVQDGLVTIKAVARIPGEKAKVAVESYDERIDPVGAVVGVRGSRIQGVVGELCNESIDVVQYTANPVLFVQRALAPAKNMEVHLNEESKRADVYLDKDQISEAIGKGGKNIKLAGMLTGYEIDIYRDESQATDLSDLYLTEFDDVIDGWVIDTFKGIGCDTAKSVLKHTKEELIRATDLEESTIEYVMQTLMTEFDDDELPKEQYGHLPARDPRYYAPLEEESVTTEEEEEK